jgi:hypothetical protein
VEVRTNRTLRLPLDLGRSDLLHVCELTERK